MSQSSGDWNSLDSTVTLRDGNKMPIVGYGTYELQGKDAYKGVTFALQAGYRHIDSAAWYYNEKECGRAILDFLSAHRDGASEGLTRASIFFTTKLQANSTSYSATKQAIEQSLRACGLGYIDLYLLHSPLGGAKARQESWRAACDAKRAGLIRSVGVSNFGAAHMREILGGWGAGEQAEAPVVNQIDLHPFMARTDVVSICRENDIVLQAWAPLVRGLRFKDTTVTKIALTHGKTPAQVLLRYSLQKRFVPLPKATSQARIVENAEIFNFELTRREINELDGLDEYFVTDWDPTNCP